MKMNNVYAMAVRSTTTHDLARMPNLSPPGGALGPETDVGARPGSRHANPILMEISGSKYACFQ